MATYEFNKIKHATLAAGVMDTLTMARDFDQVEIINFSGDSIYFTVNSETNPTVKGDDIDVIPPSSSVTVSAPGKTAVVKLISATGGDYTVAGR